MLSAPWHADAMALRYARSSPHGLTERVERWPFTAYPISGDMLALLREDTAEKWLQSRVADEIPYTP